MDVYLSFSALVSAAVFMALGLFAFGLLVKPFVQVYVKAFRQQIIEEQNVAFAVLAGLVSLSVSIIVASAIQ